MSLALAVDVDGAGLGASTECTLDGLLIFLESQQVLPDVTLQISQVNRPDYLLVAVSYHKMFVGLINGDVTLQFTDMNRQKSSNSCDFVIGEQLTSIEKQYVHNFQTCCIAISAWVEDVVPPLSVGEWVQQ